MLRRTALQLQPARSEAFLGAATSVVGVLVILVMVVGGRARSIVVSTAKAAADESAIDHVRAEALTVEQDVHQLSALKARVEGELQGRRQEREMIAAMLALAEKELEKRRAALNDSARNQYDLSRDLALAKADLEKLQRQRAELDQSSPTSLKVESYPTPIAKPVDGKELHIQLRHGYVAVVPVEDLIERLKRTARESAEKVRDRGEYTDSVGPVDGFRMRYTLERADNYVQLAHWELIPVSGELGEPIADALSQTSLLRAKLDICTPRNCTVTLWVYPDSFDAFRQLRKEFYQLGYVVAGRPLPEDTPIGGSPHGTKSAAQ